MLNILLFLAERYGFLLFVFLEIVCIWLIVQNSNYQGAKILNASNQVSGSMLAQTDKVKRYFHLRTENDSLVKANARLMEQLASLHGDLFGLETPDFCEDTALVLRNVLLFDTMYTKRQQQPLYYFTAARVLGNSTFKLTNYITIDKGTKDGIHAEMGVIDHNGAVGVVKDVSDNYAIIISLLHKNMRLSAKLKQDNLVGSLRWDMKSPQYVILDDIPKYEKVYVGDTVLTSGYSSFFPPDVMIGTVESWVLAEGSNFYQLKVKLASNFTTLKHVYVIEDNRRKELKDLQQKAQND